MVAHTSSWEKWSVLLEFLAGCCSVLAHYACTDIILCVCMCICMLCLCVDGAGEDA